jgi:long-chain acyl-CoA synthetase
MLYRALEDSTEKYAAKIAIIGERFSLTYGELLKRVRAAAGHLHSLNVESMIPLLIGLPPSPDYFVLFYAAASLGIPSIPVSPTGKVTQPVKDLPGAIAAGDSDWLKNLSRAGVAARKALNWSRESGIAWEGESVAFRRSRMITGDRITAVSTSGTTGDPILHWRSAEFLCRRVALRIRAWGITPDDVMLSTGPFTSGANVDHHLVLPILAGCQVVVLEKFNRRKVVEAIRREKVTILYSVPLTFETLAYLPDSYSPDLSSVRLCISNGAPLAQSVHDRFLERFGIPIAQSYSGSQVAPAFTISNGRVAGAVGHKTGLFPVVILDDHGREVAVSEIGEIVFDISGVDDEYLRETLIRNPHTRDGNLYSGDLGKCDAEGNLFIVGRKSSLIKVGANRVIPAEVESVLRMHPQVTEAVVFALNPGQPEESVGAIVVSQGDLRVETLSAHCAEHLEGYKCPSRIEFRKSLPRNQHGKVVRYVFSHP